MKSIPSNYKILAKNPFIYIHMVSLAIVISLINILGEPWYVNLIIIQIIVGVLILSVQMFNSERKFHTCNRCNYARFIHWEAEKKSDYKLVVCNDFQKKWWFQF